MQYVHLPAWTAVFSKDRGVCIQVEERDAYIPNYVLYYYMRL